MLSYRRKLIIKTMEKGMRTQRSKITNPGTESTIPYAESRSFICRVLPCVSKEKPRTEPQRARLEPLFDKLRELTDCQGLFEDMVAYLKRPKTGYLVMGEILLQREEANRRKIPSYSSLPLLPQTCRWISNSPFWGKIIFSP
jgi:hypothetical protein